MTLQFDHWISYTVMIERTDPNNPNDYPGAVATTPTSSPMPTLKSTATPTIPPTVAPTTACNGISGAEKEEKVKAKQKRGVNDEKERKRECMCIVISECFVNSSAVSYLHLNRLCK